MKSFALLVAITCLSVPAKAASRPRIARPGVRHAVALLGLLVAGCSSLSGTDGPTVTTGPNGIRHLTYPDQLAPGAGSAYFAAEIVEAGADGRTFGSPYYHALEPNFVGLIPGPRLALERNQGLKNPEIGVVLVGQGASLAEQMRAREKTVHFPDILPLAPTTAR